MNPRYLAYKKLHAAARAAGLDEDGYRDRLEQLTGKRSAKLLGESELAKAVELFYVKQTAAHPHTAKVKALWIAAYNLGALASGNDTALDGFVARQTGKERLAFLTPAEANSVTEALKAICAREGFAVPADGMEARKLLLRAQWAKLTALKQTAVPGEDGLDGWASRVIAGRRESHRGFKRHQLDQAAILLGRWIRKTQAARAA